jgi:hypothetical protein
MINRHAYILIRKKKNRCVRVCERDLQVRDADEASPRKRGAELHKWPQLHLVTTHAQQMLPLMKAPTPSTSDRCDGWKPFSDDQIGVDAIAFPAAVYSFIFILCNYFLV